MEKKKKLKVIAVILGVFLIFGGLAALPSIFKGKKSEAVVADDTKNVRNDEEEQKTEQVTKEEKITQNDREEEIIHKEEKTTEEKKLVENPTDILVLVNKKNYLSADYIPPDLVEAKIPFSFSGDSPKKLLRKEAAEALEQLFLKAKEDNIEIVGVSGYRSYNTQKAIFASQVERRGEEEANKISARPGESEHQTGLAIDVSSPSVNYRLVEKFGETKEGKWLAQNAPEFGFIIRYAKDKTDITGYLYEPWHIRYVGVQATKEISEKGITLEEYHNKF